MKLTREQIVDKAYNAFEEDSAEAKAFLETNIDKIADELIRLDTTDEDFLDFLQNEIEKYSEYLALE